jgi:hypothetical protein
MLNLVLTTRPDGGKIQRTCMICHEPYEGWNFVVCHSCELEKQYIVTHLWNGVQN